MSGFNLPKMVLEEEESMEEEEEEEEGEIDVDEDDDKKEEEEEEDDSSSEEEDKVRKRNVENTVLEFALEELSAFPKTLRRTRKTGPPKHLLERLKRKTHSTDSRRLRSYDSGRYYKKPPIKTLLPSRKPISFYKRQAKKEIKERVTFLLDPSSHHPDLHIKFPTGRVIRSFQSFFPHLKNLNTPFLKKDPTNPRILIFELPPSCKHELFSYFITDELLANILVGEEVGILKKLTPVELLGLGEFFRLLGAKIAVFIVCREIRKMTNLQSLLLLLKECMGIFEKPVDNEIPSNDYFKKYDDHYKSQWNEFGRNLDSNNNNNNNVYFGLTKEEEEEKNEKDKKKKIDSSERSISTEYSSFSSPIQRSRYNIKRNRIKYYSSNNNNNNDLELGRAEDVLKRYGRGKSRYMDPFYPSPKIPKNRFSNRVYGPYREKKEEIRKRRISGEYSSSSIRYNVMGRREQENNDFFNGRSRGLPINSFFTFLILGIIKERIGEINNIRMYVDFLERLNMYSFVLLDVEDSLDFLSHPQFINIDPTMKTISDKIFIDSFSKLFKENCKSLYFKKSDKKKKKNKKKVKDRKDNNNNINNNNTGNVILRCRKEGKEFLVHKEILILRANMFFKFLQFPGAEFTSELENQIIDIDILNSSELEHLLDYLYLSKIKTSNYEILLKLVEISEMFFEYSLQEYLFEKISSLFTIAREGDLLEITLLKNGHLFMKLPEEVRNRFFDRLVLKKEVVQNLVKLSSQEKKQTEKVESVKKEKEMTIESLRKIIIEKEKKIRKLMKLRENRKNNPSVLNTSLEEFEEED